MHGSDSRRGGGTVYLICVKMKRKNLDWRRSIGLERLPDLFEIKGDSEFFRDLLQAWPGSLTVCSVGYSKARLDFGQAGRRDVRIFITAY
jgi:hypothetical protein